MRIESTDLTTYPDVTVVCGSLERSRLDHDAVTNPVLIVEVLSDSTEAYDRGEKFAHYRRLPSLEEYVLVSQRRPRLELYRRAARGHWVLFEAGPGESLEVASIGVPASKRISCIAIPSRAERRKFERERSTKLTSRSPIAVDRS